MRKSKTSLSISIIFIFIVAVIVILLLWFSGYMNEDKVGKPPEEVCVKMEEGDIRCYNASIIDKVRNFFTWNREE